MARRIQARFSEEHGAFAVLFSILVVAIVGMAGLVLDLASLRADSRASQSVTDFSATAGAAYLDPNFGGTPYSACSTAWKYFKTNAPGVPADNSDPCAPFQALAACTAATPPLSITKTIGRYVVRITVPAPDSLPEMEGRSDAGLDGSQCQRLAINVATNRSYVFAGVMGLSNGSSQSHAVARTGSRGQNLEQVALIVLDPTGRNALVAKGQASVQVRASGAYPGIIAVDSNGTEMSASTPNERRCGTTSDFSIDATGTQNASITTTGTGSRPGTIYSYALVPGNGTSHSYEQADVLGGRLSPQPTPNSPITRAPVDNAYNCSSSNGCPQAGSVPPFIDNLRTAVGTTGAPFGYATYTGPCRTTPSTPPIVLTGNMYVPCNNFDISNSVTFDLGNVVFQGGVNVGSSTGALTINASGLDDRYVYFRSGNFVKDAQARVTLRRTMVYLHNGAISFGAGSGAVTWIAPTGGDFKNLGLWSESMAAHEMGGQAGLSLEGIFFTPNAFPFRFSGQGAQYQTKAQFFVYRMEVTGQGALVMQPDPDRIILIPLLGVGLIR
jgi:hypothetical protein